MPHATVRLQKQLKDLNPAERDFVTSLAHEVGRSLVVAAAEPERTFAPGSLPARLKKACQTVMTGPRAAAAQQRASALLQADAARRQQYFGHAGPPGSDAAMVAASGSGLNEALQAKLATAVRSRLTSQDDLVKNVLSGLTHRKTVKVSKTKVETGHFLGDVLTEPETSAWITEPQTLEFRWSTTEPSANIGKWQLVEDTGGLGGLDGLGGWARPKVLAQGSAGVPGAVFTIDFTKWIPSEPPSTGARRYTVRVAAFKNDKEARVPWRALAGR